jgi:hypothetical protein
MLKMNSFDFILGFIWSCCLIRTWCSPSCFSKNQGLPHAGDEASDGKRAAGNDEPQEKPQVFV